MAIHTFDAKRNEIGHLSRLDREAPKNTPFVWTEVTTLNNNDGAAALQAQPVQKYIGDHTDLFGYLLQLQRKSRKLAAARASADAPHGRGSGTSEHQTETSNQLQDRDQSQVLQAEASSDDTKSSKTQPPSKKTHNTEQTQSDQDSRNTESAPIVSARGQNNKEYQEKAVDHSQQQARHEIINKTGEASPTVRSESASSSRSLSAQEHDLVFPNPALSSSSASNHDNADAVASEAGIDTLENSESKLASPLKSLPAGTDSEAPREASSTNNEVPEGNNAEINDQAQAKDFLKRKEQIATLKSKIVSAVMNDDPDGAASAVAAWQTLVRT